MVGVVIFALIRARHTKAVSKIAGWRTLVAGFILIFFGTLIDITDNFEELNRFVIVGNTEIQAFLEKVIGYLLGFLLLAFGGGYRSSSNMRSWLERNLRCKKNG